jgi:NADH-quinone oxidoreductase subunit J
MTLLESIGFYLLAALLVAAAILVIAVRSAVHSALALVAALFLIAIFFLTLSAPMVAVLQILVYAGAIMVLFLFVIMLLNPGAIEPRPPARWGLAAAGAAVLILELALLFAFTEAPQAQALAPASEDFGSPVLLARVLFADFVLPFEIASILLLVAVIGAVVIGKRE